MDGVAGAVVLLVAAARCSTAVQPINKKFDPSVVWCAAGAYHSLGMFALFYYIIDVNSGGGGPISLQGYRRQSINTIYIFSVGRVSYTGVLLRRTASKCSPEVAPVLALRDRLRWLPLRFPDRKKICTQNLTGVPTTERRIARCAFFRLPKLPTANYRKFLSKFNSWLFVFKNYISCLQCRKQKRHPMEIEKVIRIPTIFLVSRLRREGRHTPDVPRIAHERPPR